MSSWPKGALHDSADVVVVGAGVAGLAAAHHVAEIARIGLTALFDAVADRPARAAGGHTRPAAPKATPKRTHQMTTVG